jgi:hypothetical protein
VHEACEWAAEPSAKTKIRGNQAFIGNPLVIGAKTVGSISRS